MADNFQEKTEKATPKKLADVHKKGQVCKSQDLTEGFVILGFVCALFFFLNISLINLSLYM